MSQIKKKCKSCKDLQINTTQGKMVILDCGEISNILECFRVITSYHQLKGLMKIARNEDGNMKLHIYHCAQKCLLQYSKKQLINHFEKEDKEYQDFCNDVAIYYAYRKVLFNTTIPMTEIK